MAITFPKIDSSYGLTLRVCSSLKGKQSSDINQRLIKETRVARYQGANGSVYTRAWMTDKKDGHLHIECACSEMLPMKNKPKATHKKADIAEMIQACLGRTAEAHISAHFKVGFDEIPEDGIIRALTIEQKMPSMSIKVKGCSLALTGFPIDSIEWRELVGKKPALRIELKGQMILDVTENYLCEAWDWIESQFLLFVLKRESNE